jgi:hypothetical protein
MLEFLLGKELYERFAEIKGDLKAALLISLAIYGGLFIVICFFLQGSGDPASFKLLPSRGSKKGGMAVEKFTSGEPHKKEAPNRAITLKENLALDTVWGILDRDETGKVLLTPDLVTLLMRYTMIEPAPVLVPDKPKKAEKKTEIPAPKKSKKKKQATPEQAVPEKKVMQDKKIEKAKDKTPTVPEVPKPAPEKKNVEPAPLAKPAEIVAQPETVPVQEKKVPQQLSKASKPEQVQESKPEAKPIKNGAQAKTEQAPQATPQGEATTSTGNSRDGAPTEGGSSSGSGNGYTGGVTDGIGIEFTDGPCRNDRPDGYYLQLIEEINHLIKEQWQPLAGWEDAGAVVVEIKMDKNGACASRIITASKAGAKNHRALTIARLIGSFGKIRGRTFNLMFM